MDGKWKLSLTTPMGPGEMTFDLSTGGEGITGTCESQFGSTEVAGTGDGEDVELKTTLTIPQGPLELTFKGKHVGAEYNGDVQLGAFGSGTFTGAPA